MPRMDTFPRYEVRPNDFQGGWVVSFFSTFGADGVPLADSSDLPMKFFTEQEAYHFVRQLNAHLLEARGRINPNE